MNSTGFDFSLLGLSDKKVGLAFSCGKDSLATWLFLRENGYHVFPYYMQIVPGLHFVEHSLNFYERFFQTHIFRLIHPNFYPSIDGYEFQPPHRHQIIDELSVPLFGYEDVEEGFRRTAGLAPDAWIAVGTKRADSPLRAKRIKASGVNYATRVFHPIAEWSKADVFDCLEKHQCPLPIDYELFGRSFDGWDHRFLAPIRERFPNDYARILEWFPEAILEFDRKAVAERHGQAKNLSR